MARLVVLKWGENFAELTLQEGHEYLVGRQPQSHIYLDIETGISRKHLRIFQEGDLWVVENVSRLGNLQKDGKIVSKIYLEKDCQFSVGDFTFLFEPQHKTNTQSESSVNSDPKKSTETSLASISSQSNGQSSVRAGNPTLMPATNASSTHILNSSLKAFINMKGTDSGHDVILELEGHLWVAGRDPLCEIHIDDTHASRKHFEITRINHEFFITDLASANGTELNGQLLPPHKPTKVLSGDNIQIQNVSLLLEIRDVHFEEKFALAKKQMQMVPSPQMMGYPPTSYQSHSEMHGMLALPPPDFSTGEATEEGVNALFDWRKLNRENIKKFDFKKHKIRILLGLLVPVLIIGLMDDAPKKDLAEQKDSASKGPTLDSLTEEQRAAIKDTFNLAQQHFHTLKYELCLTELRKLHGIIPNYENSKKLQGFCEQGAILLRQEEERMAQEKKQAETEQRIVTSVEYCRSLPQAMANLDSGKTCLQEALELSPEHPEIVTFLDEIRRKEDAIENQKEYQSKVQALKVKGSSHFRRANELVNKNSLSQAIKEFDSFIKAGYPGLNDEKQQARRKIASVRSMLEEKVNSLLNECEALRANNKFKDAWLTCDRAAKEDPGNSRAEDLKRQTLSDLRSEMKSIYQDSILEESLGNVDAAKEKWRMIQKNNLEFDDYYKKSTRKLQKYGEGI